MTEIQELLNSIRNAIPKGFNSPFGPYIVLLNGIYDSHGDYNFAKKRCQELFERIEPGTDSIEAYHRTIGGLWVRLCGCFHI